MYFYSLFYIGAFHNQVTRNSHNQYIQYINLQSGICVQFILEWVLFLHICIMKLENTRIWGILFWIWEIFSFFSSFLLRIFLTFADTFLSAFKWLFSVCTRQEYSQTSIYLILIISHYIMTFKKKTKIVNMRRIRLYLDLFVSAGHKIELQYCFVLWWVVILIYWRLLSDMWFPRVSMEDLLQLLKFWYRKSFINGMEIFSIVTSHCNLILSGLWFLFLLTIPSVYFVFLVVQCLWDFYYSYYQNNHGKHCPLVLIITLMKKSLHFYTFYCLSKDWY